MWTNIASSNPEYLLFRRANGTFDPDLWRSLGAQAEADTGSGILSVISPGFLGASGIYSFTLDYGIRIAMAPANSNLSIKTVVLQVAKSANRDFYDTQTSPINGTKEAVLFFNYRNQDHGSYGHPNPAAPFNPELTAFSSGVANYSGGPVLTYRVAGATHVHQGRPQLAALARGVFDPVFNGTFYDFVYQWDLSEVRGQITVVSITVPVIVHESVIGARIDIGSEYSAIIP